jgi:hypothetical protein
MRSNLIDAYLSLPSANPVIPKEVLEAEKCRLSLEKFKIATERAQKEYDSAYLEMLDALVGEESDMWPIDEFINAFGSEVALRVTNYRTSYNPLKWALK